MIVKTRPTSPCRSWRQAGAAGGQALHQPFQATPLLADDARWQIYLYFRFLLFLLRAALVILRRFFLLGLAFRLLGELGKPE